MSVNIKFDGAADEHPVLPVVLSLVADDVEGRESNYGRRGMRRSAREP